MPDQNIINTRSNSNLPVFTITNWHLFCYTVRACLHNELAAKSRPFDKNEKVIKLTKYAMKAVSVLILLSFINLDSYCEEIFFKQNSAAKVFVKEQTPWPVTDTGLPVLLPFLGGFNDPKPSLIDFNNDGLTDLMIGQIDGSLLYLQNTGTTFVPKWSPIHERLAGIDIGTWHTFCDIDGDLDFDLFCDSRLSTIKFFRNISSGGNIQFQLESTALTSLKNGGDSVLQTGLNNTPAFADIDNDGDFDYFFGALSGRLEFHRNNGTALTHLFVFETDAYDSVLAFSGGRQSFLEAGHGFSYIKFDDYDSDSDLDLFFGDIFNFNLYLFRNDGTADSSDLNLATPDFLPFTTKGFNHPAFADLDGDTDGDMILGVALGADIDNLRFLRNESGLFVEETRNLISQIDIGTGSKPALADLDNDGDFDLLIGGNLGQLEYLENIGNIFSPSFNAITNTFEGIDVGSNSAPALVDWDNDNDFDLLIGESLGRIEYWRNDGNASNFIATLVTNQLSAFVSDTLKPIKVDDLAIPCPVDFNGDNLTDLVLGEWDYNGLANVLLYANTGSLGNPILTLVTNRLIKRENRDFTIPTVYDWDGDGKKDLIVGGRYGGFTLYLNSAPNGQFPDSLTLTKSIDTIPGYDAGQYLDIAFADIDTDGDDDAFVGEESGGMNFYRRLTSSCCIGIRGDLNNDGADATVLDLTYLIDDIFRGGPASVCPGEADLNNDGTPSTILDLTYLINNIYRGGPSGPICP